LSFTKITNCSVDEKHISQYILPIKYPFLTSDSIQYVDFAIGKMLLN